MKNKATAVIQARMGSTRLPGKVMIPLKGEHVLDRVIERVNSADNIDEVVVATSNKVADDLIADHVRESSPADVYRGSEENVQERFYEALEGQNADIIIRVTADCPLISPEFLDHLVECVSKEDVDYATAALDRTFPRGLTAEAFTVESFRTVYEEAHEPRHREHVTPYYRENSNQFEIYNVRSEEVFSSNRMIDRTDLRLTLDRPEDYNLIRKVYNEVDFDGLIDLEEVIRYIDDNNLSKINNGVQQKKVHEDSD
jgi:spore coat polysaccharide biosynthesis protein SpsF